MTFFGKLLVFLNLLIGLAFLSWSVGMFTQKLDWVDRTNMAGEKVEGEITKLKAEIDVLTLEAKHASASWGVSYTALEEIETTRENRKGVFAQRLVWAHTGDPMRRGFFLDVLIPGSGLINTDTLGAVINGPNGQPLQGADTLSETIEANNKITAGYIADIEKFKLQQRENQTQEKLLQEKVDRHAAFFDQLLNEQRYLEAFEINWYEQLGTVNRRKAQLMKRMMEY